MLAQSRRIGPPALALQTPMLVTSFSSKGFPKVQKIVETMTDFIEGAALFSAYDLYYKYIKPPFTFPSAIFLDSGGYEAGQDRDLSEISEDEYDPRKWQRTFYRHIVSNWQTLPSSPTILISYDHPKDRFDIATQIALAQEDFATRPDILHEILIKPETLTQRFVQMTNLLKAVHALRPFHIIGVTEKEIGSSPLERMVNIAKLRMALTEVGIIAPIHVFGSLDTISTLLYFVSGADIFDGLTWLRYAYVSGNTIYRENYGALVLPITTRSHMIDAHLWISNYNYLRKLELEMQRFSATGDFSSFKYHGDLVEKSHESMLGQLEG
jgi:hypothetical protein